MIHLITDLKKATSDQVYSYAQNITISIFNPCADSDTTQQGLKEGYMKAITSKEEQFAVNECKVEKRLHKGDYTRATATQIAVAALLSRSEDVTIPKIDDLCFITWGFPISHRKGEPTKTKGGLKVQKRVDRYMYNNPVMGYSIEDNTFTVKRSLADKITAAKKQEQRKHMFFNQREKSRTVKNVPTSKFKNVISKMLYMHLIEAGKLAY